MREPVTASNVITAPLCGSVHARRSHMERISMQDFWRNARELPDCMNWSAIAASAMLTIRRG